MKSLLEFAAGALCQSLLLEPEWKFQAVLESNPDLRELCQQAYFRLQCPPADRTLALAHRAAAQNLRFRSGALISWFKLQTAEQTLLALRQTLKDHLQLVSGPGGDTVYRAFMAQGLHYLSCVEAGLEV